MIAINVSCLKQKKCFCTGSSHWKCSSIYCSSTCQNKRKRIYCAFNFGNLSWRCFQQIKSKKEGTKKNENNFCFIYEEKNTKTWNKTWIRAQKVLPFRYQKCYFKYNSLCLLYKLNIEKRRRKKGYSSIVSTKEFKFVKFTCKYKTWGH